MQPINTNSFAELSGRWFKDFIVENGKYLPYDQKPPNPKEILCYIMPYHQSVAGLIEKVQETGAKYYWTELDTLICERTEKILVYIFPTTTEDKILIELACSDLSHFKIDPSGA